MNAREEEGGEKTAPSSGDIWPTYRAALALAEAALAEAPPAATVALVLYSDKMEMTQMRTRR